MAKHSSTSLPSTLAIGNADNELSTSPLLIGQKQSALAPPVALAKPICVDLDGTLIRTDTLVEGLISLIAKRRGIGHLPGVLTSNRAAFKQRVALIAELRVDSLPFNTEFIAYLREQKLSGRRLILATAANEKTAQAIADYLLLFDEVIASDGMRNLKAEAKADELVRRFGEKGFDYAGDSRADLAVWRKADGRIIVNAAADVAQEARALGNVIAEFSSGEPLVLAGLRAMRPHQWVKNFLVFVPLLAARSFTDPLELLGAAGMFLAFCATASGLYLVNDLLDLEADRSHPRKRNRPFASGALPLALGGGLAIVLVTAGITLALSVGAAQVLLAYVAITIAYSLRLKAYPLLDVFILASLYTLRIIAGGVATSHRVTLWLLAFSGFTFSASRSSNEPAR